MTPKVKTVTVSKARTEFDALLKRIAKGGEVIITKQGHPVARLLPPLVPKKWDKTVFDKIRAFRGHVTLPKGEIWKDLINAGRRIGI